MLLVNGGCNGVYAMVCICAHMLGNDGGGVPTLTIHTQYTHTIQHTHNTAHTHATLPLVFHTQTPSGTAPPPTCLVALRPTMLFLGSYVADSILVHAVKETGGPSGGPSGPPPSGAPAVGDKRKAEGGPGGGDEGEGDKRQRLDGIGNDQHVDVDAEEEEEEVCLCMGV